MKKQRKIKIYNIFILLFILIILAIVFFFLYKSLTKQKEETLNEDNTLQEEVIEPEEPIVEEKKLTIIDEESNSRNIAVMYNNISTVWGYQAGLQDAYLVYEIIVEGGYTRLMAIFKDKETTRIGSVRSSRP